MRFSLCLALYGFNTSSKRAISWRMYSRTLLPTYFTEFSVLFFFSLYLNRIAFKHDWLKHIIHLNDSTRHIYSVSMSLGAEIFHIHTHIRELNQGTSRMPPESVFAIAIYVENCNQRSVKSRLPQQQQQQKQCTTLGLIGRIDMIGYYESFQQLGGMQQIIFMWWWCWRMDEGENGRRRETHRRMRRNAETLAHRTQSTSYSKSSISTESVSKTTIKYELRLYLPCLRCFIVQFASQRE